MATKHLYQPDGVPDHRGEDRCSYCQMKRSHANHKLPPAPASQAVQRSWIGDKDS